MRLPSLCVLLAAVSDKIGKGDRFGAYVPFLEIGTDSARACAFSRPFNTLTRVDTNTLPTALIIGSIDDEKLARTTILIERV